jgi:hypothetical protein
MAHSTQLGFVLDEALEHGNTGGRSMAELQHIVDTCRDDLLELQSTCRRDLQRTLAKRAVLGAGELGFVYTLGE